MVLKGVWQRDVKIQVNGQQFQFRPGNLKQEIKGQAYGKWIKSERNEITFSTQEPVTICCGSDIEPHAECPFLGQYIRPDHPQSYYPCQPGLEYKLEF